MAYATTPVRRKRRRTRARIERVVTVSMVSGLAFALILSVLASYWILN